MDVQTTDIPKETNQRLSLIPWLTSLCLFMNCLSNEINYKNSQEKGDLRYGAENGKKMFNIVVFHQNQEIEWKLKMS